MLRRGSSRHCPSCWVCAIMYLPIFSGCVAELSYLCSLLYFIDISVFCCRSATVVLWVSVRVQLLHLLGVCFGL